jgi:F0F1-type ATP synthase assembly protein I
MSSGLNPNEPSSSEKKEEKKKTELFPGINQLYRDFGPYLTLGFQLAAAVLLFFFIGWWLDSTYETSPTFQLLGVLIGSVGGMVKFFRTVSNLNKTKKSP